MSRLAALAAHEEKVRQWHDSLGADPFAGSRWVSPSQQGVYLLAFQGSGSASLQVPAAAAPVKCSYRVATDRTAASLSCGSQDRTVALEFEGGLTLSLPTGLVLKFSRQR